MTKRDLVGISDIAARLGYPRNTVEMWRKRRRLPEPDYIFGASPVWRWTRIEQWARDTGRLKASPAKGTNGAPD